MSHRYRMSKGRLRGELVAGLALLALLVAGCAGSTAGGVNDVFGLQGATNDHPAPPPRIASSGPDREYAFVYDNQVWVRQEGASAARQVTRLTLSASADIRWGPLVWSASGDSLAFALVENLTPATPTRAAGPIYYLDLSTCLAVDSGACATYQTPMTGSVYGHTYDWYNDDLLIAGSGAGLSAYDRNDPNGPRVWQLRTTSGEAQDQNCPQPTAYGETQVVGATLYYTCMTLPNLGSGGVIGKGFLNRLSLQPFATAFATSDPEARDQRIAAAQNGDQFAGTELASLGSVYLDPQGSPVAGAWRVGDASHRSLAYEVVGAVDDSASTAGREVCQALVSNVTCQAALTAVGAQPLSVHAQIAISPGGAIAYQGARLYATTLTTPLDSTSPYAPEWITDDTLVVTSVLSTATDATGATRQKTSARLASASGLTTLIAGASDVALR